MAEEELDFIEDSPEEKHNKKVRERREISKVDSLVKISKGIVNLTNLLDDPEPTVVESYVDRAEDLIEIISLADRSGDNYLKIATGAVDQLLKITKRFKEEISVE